MTTQISHFINGKRTTGTSKRTADVMDPNTGQVQAKAPMASSADVDAAVAGAVEAQKEWAAFNPQRRARVMMRFIDLVNQNANELAELLVKCVCYLGPSHRKPVLLRLARRDDDGRNRTLN